MSFRKNIFTVLSGMVLVLAGAWLLDLPMDWIILGIVFFIPGAVAILLIRDFFDKMIDKELRPKLTWQYYFGSLLVALSVIAWLWFIKSATDKEFYVRMGVTFFLACMGAFWDNFFYAKSVAGPGEKESQARDRENNRWRKIRKMAAKKGKKGALPILGAYLKYRTVGNDYNGDLLFDSPIATWNGKPITHEELRGMPDDKTGKLQSMIQVFDEYLVLLTANLVEKTEKKE